MERLRGPLSWLDALLGRARPRPDSNRPNATNVAESLAECARVEDWRRIPRLVSLPFSPDAEVSAAAALTLHRLLAMVPSSRLPWLEKAVRRDQAEGCWNDRYDPAWGELRPETVSARAAALGPAVVSLCTFHPSGWVRAEALTVLRTRFAPNAYRTNGTFSPCLPRRS